MSGMAQSIFIPSPSHRLLHFILCQEISNYSGEEENKSAVTLTNAKLLKTLQVKLLAKTSFKLIPVTAVIKI